MLETECTIVTNVVLFFFSFHSFSPQLACRNVNLYLTNISQESNVCVQVLRPSQPCGIMLSAVSLPNHTFHCRLSPLSS